MDRSSWVLNNGMHYQNIFFMNRTAFQNYSSKPPDYIKENTVVVVSSQRLEVPIYERTVQGKPSSVLYCRRYGKIHGKNSITFCSTL
jgi:hypothetical protein